MALDQKLMLNPRFLFYLILTFLRRSRFCRWAISDAKDALSIVIQMITAAAMELEAKIDRTSHALAESAGVGKH